jgi:transcriptional regulator with PAS, ATPase and Fis domain
MATIPWIFAHPIHSPGTTRPSGNGDIGRRQSEESGESVARPYNLSMSDPPPAADRPFRWQALLHRVADAAFVLDRRRRLLFVNRAWERLTGFTPDAVRGLVCRRPASVGTDGPPEDALAHALTPPAEVSAGHPARARRRAVGPSAAPRWWDVDFLPLRLDEGCLVVGRIVPVAEDTLTAPSLAQLPERLVDLRQRRLRSFTFDLFEGRHPRMGRLVEQARIAATLESPALIVGEPGTGKHTLARVLHAQGPRRDRGFVALDCSLLPPAAVADVLQVPGNGVLYIASPECLPPDLQLGLLSCPARLVLGCRAEPEGRLLDRLFWQASVLRLDLVPLRERPEDLPRLVERILADGPVRGLSAEAREACTAYAWPGNLRELRQVVLESAERAAGEWIDLAELPSPVRLALHLEREPLVRARPLDLEKTLEAVESRLIALALKRADGNRTRAADLLGISRARLLRRIEAFGQGNAPGEP